MSTAADPKSVATLDRTGAEAVAASATHPFCGGCGKPMTAILADRGFWPATGEERSEWLWVCSAGVKRSTYDGFHGGATSLGWADPAAVAGEKRYSEEWND